MSGSWRKNKQDKYFRLAKEQNYRARSAFKLIQLNKRYNFLSSCERVVDLGAAPGGWLQVCAKFMAAGSQIIGIDLHKIKPIEGIDTFQEDITTQSCRAKLTDMIGKTQKIDCFLHDGAPDLGGATWAADAFVQVELVLHSAKLASEFLKQGGWFITKVFRSKDYNNILWVVNQLFQTVDVCKPPSSRAASAEVFLVCQGYLAPKRIDPRMFDPKEVFTMLEGYQQEAKSVLRMDLTKKKVRHRDGYGDDVHGRAIYKDCTVLDLIKAGKPEVLLGQVNSVVFGPDDTVFKNHKKTDDDVKALLADLKVLDKVGFKQILKWRRSMKKYYLQLMAVNEPRVPVEKKQPLTAEQEEKALQMEIMDLYADSSKAAMKVKRKARQKRLNAAKTLIMAADNSKDMVLDEEEDENDAMFKVAQIEDDTTLKEVQEGEAVDLFTSSDSDADVEMEPVNEEDQPSRLEQMEAELNDHFEMYKAVRLAHGDTRKKRRTNLGVSGDVEFDYNNVDEETRAELFDPFAAQVADKPTSSLVLKAEDLNSAPAKKKSTFFTRDIFEGLGDLEEEDEDSEADVKYAKNVDKMTEFGLADDVAEEYQHLNEDAESDDEAKHAKAQETAAFVAALHDKLGLPNAKKNPNFNIENPNAKPQKMKQSAKKAQAAQDAFLDKKESAFEVVAQEFSDEDLDDARDMLTDSDDQEISDLSTDEEARAETLAMGTKMIRKRKRQQIIDDSYNRYSWGGQEDLPDWFEQDQRLHNKPIKPITKKEVDFFKQKLKAINARPIKAIVEARARKKMKIIRKREDVKRTAEGLNRQEGMTEAHKIKAIQALYRKTDLKIKRENKTYVVSTKNGGGIRTKHKHKGGGGKLVSVDKRMKTDKRGEARARRRAARGKFNTKKTYKKTGG